MAELDKVLAAAVKAQASDVHVAPGEPFILRRFGRLRKIQSPMLTGEQCEKLIFQVLNEEQQERLLDDLQLDFAYEIDGVGRFRGSAMRHQSGLSAAFRIIPSKIPTFDQLDYSDRIGQWHADHGSTSDAACEREQDFASGSI